MIFVRHDTNISVFYGSVGSKGSVYSQVAHAEFTGCNQPLSIRIVYLCSSTELLFRMPYMEEFHCRPLGKLSCIATWNLPFASHTLKRRILISIVYLSISLCLILHD